VRSLIPLAVPAMLALLGGSAAAQGDVRLRERLDPSAYAEVSSIVSEARAAGLPERPLVQKALEGASKGAGGPQVVEAVRRLRDRLATAREALGPTVGERELVSAASALFAGATPRMLQSVRRLPDDGQDLSGAFTALAFLLHRGVSPAVSFEVIGSLVRSRAGEEDFLSLQQLVEADLYRGASPVEAARSRARDLVGSRPPGP
jgi:hypothetical protein